MKNGKYIIVVLPESKTEKNAVFIKPIAKITEYKTDGWYDIHPHEWVTQLGEVETTASYLSGATRFFDSPIAAALALLGAYRRQVSPKKMRELKSSTALKFWQNATECLADNLDNLGLMCRCEVCAATAEAVAQKLKDVQTAIIANPNFSPIDLPDADFCLITPKNN